MKTLTHKFVENVPEVLEDEVLYVSIPYETVIHKCCCGCGNEVVTPLSPAGWSLIFNGEAISLKPSIGNWSFACKSHYWIKNNRVHWSAKFSQKQIELVKERDLWDNLNQYKKKTNFPEKTNKKNSWFKKLVNYIKSN